MIPFVGTLLTAKLAGIAIAVAAAGMLVAGTGAYFRGHSNGVDKDKARSDAVIIKMVADHTGKLAVANKLIKDQNDAMQANKERAERELQNERQRNAIRRASDAATNDVLRDQLSEFARGPGSATDTLTACRSESSALGNVLARTLQAHGVCSGNAEEEAGNARSLLSAWPTKVN